MLTCVRATKTYDDEWSDDDYVALCFEQTLHSAETFFDEVT